MLDLPRIVGHRGAAASAPENTLAGIVRAHALGCRWVELDAKLSFDNVVLLMHDERLERTTDGAGYVADHSAAELKRLDAGAWKGPRFAGEPIPTLSEAIALMSRLGMGANIEIKPCTGREVETGRRVAQELRRNWPRGHGLLLSSFSPAALEAARSAAPELPRGLLVEAPPPDWPTTVRRLGCQSINPWHEELGPETVEAARGMGIIAIVYTVNDPARAAALLEAGVASIITDMPERLIPALA
ncbi:MAG TPA: glycerophosphodiester phosphodiesterase [Alphaproteobacteria bacterium]|nr:glycerophosphodiester phosphodiesterase [Alphaproteobacteria bacterium]